MTTGKRKNSGLIMVSGLLGILGGVLIITSGLRTQGFLITVLNLAQQQFGSDLPGTIRWVTGFSISVLASIIALGGILVVLGGTAVILKHTGIGRLMIGLGGGLGFFGIAIAVGISLVTFGYNSIIAQLDYWIGVLIASIASYMARKA